MLLLKITAYDRARYVLSKVRPLFARILDKRTVPEFQRYSATRAYFTIVTAAA